MPFSVHRLLASQPKSPPLSLHFSALLNVSSTKTVLLRLQVPYHRRATNLGIEKNRKSSAIFSNFFSWSLFQSGSARLIFNSNRSISTTAQALVVYPRKGPGVRGGSISAATALACNRRFSTSSAALAVYSTMPNCKQAPATPDKAEGADTGSTTSSCTEVDSLYEKYSLDQIRELLARKDDAECHGQLRLELDNQTGIGALCIDSPQRKNAFSGLMMTQFSEMLDRLETWTEGRAVIIYGADEFFCSGADLKMVQNLSDKTGAYFISTLMQDNLRRLERLPLISVALIEGKALGGGSELITACDFRVMSAQSKIGFVHARLGVIPAFGGGYRLIRLLGPTKALQLMLSASLIDAPSAQQLGLVQHILPAGLSGKSALSATVEWFLKSYGHISPFTLHAVKDIVATGSSKITDDEALRHEQKVFLTVWGSDEHKRALASNIKHNN